MLSSFTKRCRNTGTKGEYAETKDGGEKVKEGKGDDDDKYERRGRKHRLRKQWWHEAKKEQKNR